MAVEIGKLLKRRREMMSVHRGRTRGAAESWLDARYWGDRTQQATEEMVSILLFMKQVLSSGSRISVFFFF
jgi:hypothetical protein